MYDIKIKRNKKQNPKLEMLKSISICEIENKSIFVTTTNQIIIELARTSLFP